MKSAREEQRTKSENRSQGGGRGEVKGKKSSPIAQRAEGVGKEEGKSGDIPKFPLLE